MKKDIKEVKNKKNRIKGIMGYPILGVNYLNSDSDGSGESSGDGGGMGESKVIDIVKMLVEEVLSEMPRDFDENMLTFDKIPKQILDNYYKNITISVAFVKKDGSIRHMAFRKKLNAYIRSTNEKTELQSNILQNNNLLQVYDTNLFIKAKKEGKDPNMAARSSFRRVTMDNVLGFLTGGKFYDARGINKIKERYGEDVYNSLTPGMKKAMLKEIEYIDGELNSGEK